MPLHTEAYIKALCNKILSPATEDERQRLITELRRALREHVQLAKDSLQVQADVLTSLESKSSRRRAA